MKRELAKGNNNIDVGVMQVNLRWHGDKFASLEEKLQPLENIDYAAKLLCDLKKRYGSWHKAVRYYHSASPAHHKKYSRKVLLSWLKYENT